MNWCWLYRMRAGLGLGGETGLPGWARRHLERCMDCRCRLERERQAATAFTRAALGEQQRLPPFLAARITARVAAERNESAPGTTRSGLFHWRWAHAATVASLAVLALGTLIFAPGLGWRNNRAANPVWLTPELAALWTEGSLMEKQLPRWSGALEQPFQREIALAMEDGRRAWAGLVENFVPDSMLETMAPQSEK